MSKSIKFVVGTIRILSNIFMAFGVVGGISIIIMLAPDTVSTGEGILDEVTVNHPMRWVYGLGLIFGSVFWGMIAHGFAYIIEFLYESRSKIGDIDYVLNNIEHEVRK